MNVLSTTNGYIDDLDKMKVLFGKYLLGVALKEHNLLPWMVRSQQ